MKVDYFIIGSPKSGTTSLHYYLSKSADIIGQKHMECIFFHDDKEFDKGLDFLKEKYFFDSNPHLLNQKKILIKHSSAFFFQKEIIRAYQSNPEIEFILILRNPVNRFISSYLMEAERSGYKTPIADAIQKSLIDDGGFEYRAFNRYGQYDVLLKELLKIIPLQKLHIITYEDLVKDPISTIKSLNKSLNIENYNFGLDESKAVKNVYKKAKSSNLIKALVSFKRIKIIIFIKNCIPPKYVFSVNAFIDKILYKKSAKKPEFSEDIYKTLYSHYISHIIEFELLTGIKTKWLEDKPA